MYYALKILYSFVLNFMIDYRERSRDLNKCPPSSGNNSRHCIIWVNVDFQCSKGKHTQIPCHIEFDLT